MHGGVDSKVENNTYIWNMSQGGICHFGMTDEIMQSAKLSVAKIMAIHKHTGR
jgi:hypothetical protein